MSERLASSMSRLKLGSSQIRQDEVPFAGGVNTEDQYGGNLGQGAMRDCQNVDIGDRGYRTKGGWVRFGQSSYTTPPEGARVIYCKYEYYMGLGGVTHQPPTPHSTISNFNGSGVDVYVLGSRWRDGYDTGAYSGYYLSSFLEVFFVVFDDSNLNIYDGSTIGLETTTMDPGWVFYSGPYSIDELGNDATDQLYAETEGLDVINLNEDIDSYREDAYLVYRALVTPAFSAPYTGIGVFTYKDSVYALVDLGSLFDIVVCNSSNAWVSVFSATMLLLYFENGSKVIEEGATITGGTSGATAKAYRVVIMDGSFEGGDARGYISVSSSTTGTFVAAEDLEVAAVVYATTPPSGTVVTNVTTTNTSTGTTKLRSVRYNFSGFTKRDSVYFVTGTSYAFEFSYDDDDDVYVITPIRTLIGIDDIANYRSLDTEDMPQFIAVNRGTLFLGYSGGSIQNSASGDPLDFRAVVGYDEKSIGEEITNFFPEISGSLLVSGKNSWWALYGDNQQNYDLQLITQDVGALADAGASAAGLVFIDAQGITSIKQATEFGNWNVNSLTRDIDRKMQWILRYCTPVKTVLIRDKSIIRFIFDQTVAGLTETRPGSVWIAMKVSPRGVDGYTFGSYNKQIIDITEGEMVIKEDEPERREVFFLAADGYVYRDEQACVADDESLDYTLDTSILVARSKGVVKHWHEMYLEASCQSPSEPEVTVTYYESNGYRRSGTARPVTLASEATYWDSTQWGTAQWDDTGGNIARLKLMGLGDGISINIAGSKFNRDPDVFKSVKVNFIPTTVRRSR